MPTAWGYGRKGSRLSPQKPPLFSWADVIPFTLIAPAAVYPLAHWLLFWDPSQLGRGGRGGGDMLVLFLLHLALQASCGQVWLALSSRGLLFVLASVPSHVFHSQPHNPNLQPLLLLVVRCVPFLSVSRTVCSFVKQTPEVVNLMWGQPLRG